MERIVCTNCGRMHNVFLRFKLSRIPDSVMAQHEPIDSGLIKNGFSYQPEDSAARCFKKKHRLVVRDVKN